MLHSLDAILGPAYFWVFAIVAVLCGLGLLLSRHPLNGAIYLIGVMLSLSGIYALLHSPFLAVLQVLVYAGAIMMLVVFVIMVLNQAKEHTIPVFDWFSVVGLALPVVLGLALVLAQGDAHAAPAGAAIAAAPTPPPRGEVAVIAATMFDSTPAGGGYWLLFELTGVVLLAAVVGAVVLAKRKLDSPPPEQPKADGGHH
jgi:NADH-quinone oxidoreductase subunit J